MPFIKVRIVVIPLTFVIPLHQASWLSVVLAIHALIIDLSIIPMGLTLHLPKSDAQFFNALPIIEFDVPLDIIILCLRSPM